MASPSPDILALLAGCMSAVDATRRAAEASLTEMRRAAADPVPLALLSTARFAGDPQLRQFAAVMLRRVVDMLDGGSGEESGKREHWFRMSAAARGEVEAGLLAAVQVEGDEEKVRKPLTLALATVAGLRLGEGGVENPWPALWATMYAGASAGGPCVAEASLQLFEYLAGHLNANPELERQSAALGAVFQARLTDGAAPARVRVAAFRAAACTMSEARSLDAARAYAPLLPDLLAAFEALARGGPSASEAAGEAAECLVDVASTHAAVFRGCLGGAVGVLAGVAGGGASVDILVRRLALEAALSLAEGSPGMVRKLPGEGFLGALLPVVTGFMLEHGAGSLSEGEWEAAPGIDDPLVSLDDDSCNVSLGEQALERLAEAIGAKRTLPALAGAVGALLAAGAASPAAWRARYAAVSAITVTATLVGEAGEATLRGIAAQLAPVAAGDPSPRVRCNAQFALGAFCFNAGPAFQSAAHDLIAPALLAGLRDPSLRVRGQAARACEVYAQALEGAVDPPLLAPYLRAMLEGTLALLSLPPASQRDRDVREAAMVALAALCDAAGELARPFYGGVMPGLQAMLAAADPPLQPRAPGAEPAPGAELAPLRHARLLRARALECVTILGAAVGLELFGADALATLTGIAGMVAVYDRERRAAEAAEEAAAAAGAGLRPPSQSVDDSSSSYMWSALTRLAETLPPSDFAPWVPHILPALVGALCATTLSEEVPEPSAEGEGGEEEEEEEDDDDDGFMRIENSEGVIVRVRCADLDEKLNTTTCLVRLLDRLQGPLLAPYMGVTLAALLKQLRTASGPLVELRRYAAQALAGALVSSASQLPVEDALASARAVAAGGGSVSPVASAYLAALNASLDELQNALKDEIDAIDGGDTLKTLVEAVGAVAESACARASFAGGVPRAPHAASSPADYVPLASADVLRDVTQTLLKVLQGAIQRRAVRAAELQTAEDADEETREAAEEADSADERLRFACADAIGALVRSHGGAYMAAYSELVASRVRDLAHPAVLPADRRLAVFLVDDVLEFAGDAALCPRGAGPDGGGGHHYAEEYMPILLRCARDADNAVRQAALFGLGAAAGSLSRALYAPFLMPALVALSSVVERPPTGARGEPEDNAVTSLGKIIIHQYSPPPPGAPAPRAEVVAGFLKHLPLAHDAAEARVAAQMICSWLDAGDADVCAGPNLLAALRNLGAVLADARVRNEELSARVSATLARLQSALPQALLQELWAALPDAERRALAGAAAARG